MEIEITLNISRLMYIYINLYTLKTREKRGVFFPYIFTWL